ncbi:hypothetical protein SMD11_3022 [Streptomyces albireticuli]|uniref:Gram-positive cocci surface proteins LPxTG domain-containing protein n=1 Tax=Streptomyces albireticuli TaxID=1940 RepID=A0A1Z2L305_9ACTN|nr:hypothetical protein [Streptomyces albireticuli]ARZ68666.1 hypothetical protein SMD11_3022 [Streptomyces albireticuli]
MIVYMMGVGFMGRRRTVRRAAVSIAVPGAVGLALAAAPAWAGAPPHADYQAVAQPVVGRVGETVEVELGVRNGGPGPAGRHGGHGAGTYEVTAPEGTTVTATPPPGADGRQPCVATPSPGTGPVRYRCVIGDDFPAGDRETLRFRVRIDKKVEGAEGRVRVLDHDGSDAPDPDPDNDTAPIRVEVVGRGPLAPAEPDTNSTLLLATTSGTALSAGAIALGVRRKQR